MSEGVDPEEGFQGNGQFSRTWIGFVKLRWGMLSRVRLVDELKPLGCATSRYNGQLQRRRQQNIDMGK
jgi:hypothetical protein